MSEPKEDIDSVISYYGALQSYFEERGGYEIDAQIRKVVHGLKIEYLLEMNWGDLSGGECTKIGIAQSLIKPTGLLLLDEPTHLNIESKETIEDALLDFEGTIIAVSHDVYFINKLFNVIYIEK